MINIGTTVEEMKHYASRLPHLDEEDKQNYVMMVCNAAELFPEVAKKFLGAQSRRVMLRCDTPWYPRVCTARPNCGMTLCPVHNLRCDIALTIAEAGVVGPIGDLIVGQNSEIKFKSIRAIANILRHAANPFSHIE